MRAKNGCRGFFVRTFLALAASAKIASVPRILSTHHSAEFWLYWCRWEANIWLGKGTNKQIYLGGYEKEELAAEAYDVAALKAKGETAVTNFSKERYACTMFWYRTGSK